MGAGEILVEVWIYEYDALNRRIRKVVSNGGLSGIITNGTTDFVYNSNWQCVEERDGSNDPTKQYVWGIYIDELLQQRVDVSGTPADQYPLQDLLYRTTALTDDSGDIVEAYDCDAYGNTLIFNAPGTGGNWWADDASQADQPTCDYIYTGRRFDAESRLYYFRERYYDSFAARFIGRDELPLSPSLYTYTGCKPATHLDPLGLQEIAISPEHGITIGAVLRGLGAIGGALPWWAWGAAGLAAWAAWRLYECVPFLLECRRQGDNPIPNTTDFAEYELKVREVFRKCKPHCQPKVSRPDADKVKSCVKGQFKTLCWWEFFKCIAHQHHRIPRFGQIDALKCVKKETCRCSDPEVACVDDTVYYG